MTFRPWPHQLETALACSESAIVFDMSDPGTGKTSAHLMAFVTRRAAGEATRALVVCPKTLMRSAWGNEIDQFFPQLSYAIADAKNRRTAFDFNTDIVIVNTDGVKDLAKTPKLLRGFTDIIVDECFPAGTPVDTPDGEVAIERLKEGDIVHTSGGPLPVSHTMKRNAERIVCVELEDGTQFNCTETHPIATDNGWREARTLGRMSVVRLDVHIVNKPRTVLLRTIVLATRNVAIEIARRAHCYSQKNGRQTTRPPVMEQRAALVRSAQGTYQPAVQSSGPATSSAWGQRPRSACRSGSTRNAPRCVGIQSSRPDKTTAWKRLSNLLQSRLREFTDKDGARGRRRFTSIARALGCEERCILGLTRVARVSHIKCDRPIEVFNLQVDGPHDFSVAGVLVHNCTSFKHASSQRSKAMKKLSGMFTNRYLLTGTPNANSVTELWHPMFLLDRGERLGPNFFHFRNSVQVSEQVGPMPNMVKWRDRPNALEAVFSLLKDVVIRHDFQAVMTHVPPNHVSRYDFDLKPGVMKQYKALEASCVLALKDGSITAVHAAALRTKLLQLASGAVYTEDGKYSVIDTQRYELGVELIEQRQHSIVFFNWRHQREQMELLLAKRGVSFAVIDGSVPQQRRDVIVNDFQAGAYQTILLHPQTGAHGLTLTRGEACILLSPIYEADLLKQAIHRIYRGAQDKATDTVLVQARGTVEDLVYERRLEKTNNMNDFLALAATAQARRS